MKSGPLRSSAPSWTKSLAVVLCRYNASFSQLFYCISLLSQAYFHSVICVLGSLALIWFTQSSRLLPESYLLPLFFPLPNAASVLRAFRSFLCLQVVGAPLTTQVFSLSSPAPHPPKIAHVILSSAATKEGNTNSISLNTVVMMRLFMTHLTLI